jgi:hypothetical protein
VILRQAVAPADPGAIKKGFRRQLRGHEPVDQVSVAETARNLRAMSGACSAPGPNGNVGCSLAPGVEGAVLCHGQRVEKPRSGGDDTGILEFMRVHEHWRFPAEFIVEAKATVPTFAK